MHDRKKVMENCWHSFDFSFFGSRFHHRNNERLKCVSTVTNITFARESRFFLFSLSKIIEFGGNFQ